MKFNLLLFVLSIFAFGACNNGQSVGSINANYHDTTGRNDIFSGGVKLIPIQTSKLTLYGSYIREDREYNDGINQLLSSDSIHEVIE